MVKCSNGDLDCRSFKVLGSGINFEGGNYKAKSVTQAAKRAGVKLFNRIDNNPKYNKYANKNSIKFIFGESTRGSKHKTFAYQIFRIKLAKPVTITLKNTKYEVKYKYECKRLVSEDDSEIIKIKNAIQQKMNKKGMKKLD